MKTISRYIMTLALLLTAATGAWAQTEESESFTTTTVGQTVYTGTHVKITATNLYDSGEIQLFREGQQATIETLNGETITKIVVTASKYPQNCGDVKSNSGTVEKGNPTSTIKDVNATSVVISSQYYVGIGQITVYYTGGAPSGPEVTITGTSAEGQQAEFDMPQNDVTVTYTLKRDISVDVTATMGDGTDGVRYRVKKAQQGSGYEPADLNMMQVLALVAVNDGIEHKDLTLDQDYYCRIYKLDEQTLQPTGDGVTLFNFDFAPGLYALKAFAKGGSNYAGETAFSNTFKLFQGYEVTVAAKEFITYYKDEPLYADTETSADAELYTITSVSADQAVLSAAIETAPSLTPLLIFNNSDEAKTFLLIPANEEPNLDLTVAREFKGTLEATTIAASTEGTTNYALNGKQFVRVRTALPVAANKAWLEVPTSTARSIVLVFADDDATAISAVSGSPADKAAVYDLSGRKVTNPAEKGVYIVNGKKVVVK